MPPLAPARRRTPGAAMPAGGTQPEHGSLDMPDKRNNPVKMVKTAFELAHLCLFCQNGRNQIQNAL